MRAPGRKSGLAEDTFAKLSLEATKAVTTMASVAAGFINTFWMAIFVEWDCLAVAV